MRTPFDDVVDDIIHRGYHNHRKEEHSNRVCEGILNDVLDSCEALRSDFEEGVIGAYPLEI